MRVVNKTMTFLYQHHSKTLIGQIMALLASNTVLDSDIVVDNATLSAEVRSARNYRSRHTVRHRANDAPNARHIAAKQGVDPQSFRMQHQWDF